MDKKPRWEGIFWDDSFDMLTSPHEELPAETIDYVKSVISKLESELDTAIDKSYARMILDHWRQKLRDMDPEHFMPEISIKFRLWRGTRGLRQVDQILNHAGFVVSPSTLNALERGRIEIFDSAFLERLAQFIKK